MIAVTGEALVDLVVSHGGEVQARPGGGPCNAARTMGRLGLAPVFLGSMSADGFGQILRSGLEHDGVSLGVRQPADAPTTLAVADVDADGGPHFRFYLGGTSAAGLAYPLLQAALPADLTALYTGSLALVMEPVAASIERLIASDVPPDALVMVDPNCRPEAITDSGSYRARLARILRRADVVKVSVEDLGYLYPGATAQTAAADLLGQGPGLVIVTDGPRPARAFLPGQELSVDVPAVQVADTIGAGDAFGGAFLAWWSGSALARPDLPRAAAVRAALRAAAEVAALTCTRAGAEPPWLAEVAGKAGWRAPSAIQEA